MAEHHPLWATGGTAGVENGGKSVSFGIGGKWRQDIARLVDFGEESGFVTEGKASISVRVERSRDTQRQCVIFGISTRSIQTDSEKDIAPLSPSP